MPKLREAVVTLTKGGIWAWRIPADIGESWPDGAVAHTEFRNTSGAMLADIEASDVTAEAIMFLAQPADVESVPAGVPFETFIETDDGPLKIRYGIVQRHEARFFDAPTIVATDVPRMFEDTFQRTALGWRWEPVTGPHGSTKIYNNSGVSLPYGVGANVVLFHNDPSAIRYYRPLQGDTAKITVTLLNTSAGKTGVVLCADINFISGLVVQFDSTTGTDHINFGQLTGPASVTYLGSPITHTIANNDAYTITQNDLTKVLSVYAGTDPSPGTLLGSWTDSGLVIPHGPGYRYLGFNFLPSGNFLIHEAGPEISGWAAKDDV